MWLGLLWLCTGSGLAGDPLQPTPDCDGWTLEGCPPDLEAGDWELLSSVPSGSLSSVLDSQLDIGAGIGADVAWRHTVGDWDTTIAVLDSGILWKTSALWDQVRLNQDELPPPQDPDGVEQDYDYDGNGVFDVDDYVDDPRVSTSAGEPAATGLDPSDLIAVFSDGVDDDGNGYVDDIAGWDFFRDDNDPGSIEATVYADHGTGVMRDAAQAGNDGAGIGVCPNCSILPLRLSDQLLDDGDKVALAIAYAADQGASVVVMALAALSDPPWMRDALQWAEDHDMVVVAVAGDENGYHHNAPAWHQSVLMTHSVGPSGADGTDNGNVSYLNFINCNNFGPRLDLVAASESCGTGATSRLGGATGLVQSISRSTGEDLTAAEVRHLLRATADDVVFTDAELEIARTYPAAEGWDAFYGAGRVNVGRAVEAVVDGEIPPLAALDMDWFSWHSADETLSVTGTVAAPRDAVASWTLSWGRGAEPETWTEVASGTEEVAGELGALSLANWTSSTFLPLERLTTIEERMFRGNQDLLQLRLEVTDSRGLTAVEKRGVWVHDDPWALDGFPISLGASGEAPPVLADLDGDGVQEIVLPASDGQVHVFTGSGALLDGWPVALEAHPATDVHGDAPFVSSTDGLRENIVAPAAVGDIDGDGSPDVVAVSTQGTVYAWSRAGEALDGFPTTLWTREASEFVEGMAFDDGAYGGASLGDVDGDGDLELVIAGLDQRLYLFDGDGSLFEGYPLELCHPTLCGTEGARFIHSPALGDIDGDGDLDAALGSGEIPDGYAGTLYLVDLLTGEEFPASPIDRAGVGIVTILPVVGDGHPGSPALADLDGDGDLEIASMGNLGTEVLLHHDGTEYIAVSMDEGDFGGDSPVEASNLLPLSARAIFADLDGDGVLDVATGASSSEYLISLALHVRQEFQHGLLAWSGATGASLEGFPQQVEDIGLLIGPVAADVSGDGRAEVLHLSSGGFVHAYDAAGETGPGFPHLTGGWHMGAPAVGDIDGDGYLDVVSVTREGHLFAWTTEGHASSPPPWPLWNHDPQNTSNAHTKLLPQAGPLPEVDGSGCGCTGGDQALLWLFAPLLLWTRRRR